LEEDHEDVSVREDKSVFIGGREEDKREEKLRVREGKERSEGTAV